jgi:hypothetical protein
MDSYDFLAVTVSLATGERLIQFLEDDLNARQQEMDTNHQYVRRAFTVSSRFLHCLLNVLITISYIRSDSRSFNWLSYTLASSYPTDSRYVDATMTSGGYPIL